MFGFFRDIGNFFSEMFNSCGREGCLNYVDPGAEVNLQPIQEETEDDEQSLQEEMEDDDIKAYCKPSYLNKDGIEVPLDELDDEHIDISLKTLATEYNDHIFRKWVKDTERKSNDKNITYNVNFYPWLKAIVMAMSANTGSYEVEGHSFYTKENASILLLGFAYMKELERRQKKAEKQISYESEYDESFRSGNEEHSIVTVNSESVENKVILKILLAKIYENCAKEKNENIGYNIVFTQKELQLYQKHILLFNNLLTTLKLDRGIMPKNANEGILIVNKKVIDKIPDLYNKSRKNIKNEYQKKFGIDKFNDIKFE